MPGRLVILSGTLWALLLVVQRFVVLPDLIDLFRRVVTVALLAGLGWLLLLAIGRGRRRLLWRVRRKLILSYVFLGVVPVVLVLLFALAGSIVLYTNIAAYMFRDGIDDLIENVGQVAETSAVELRRQTEVTQAALDRKYDSLSSQFPALSLVVLPVPGAAGALQEVVAQAGPWRHGDVPASIPDWVLVDQSFRGALVVERTPGDEGPTLLIRAAVLTPDGGRLVVADLPVDTDQVARLHERTGTRIGDFTVTDGQSTTTRQTAGVPTNGRLFQQTVAFMDATDWASGERRRVSISLEAPYGGLYDRLAAAVQSELMGVSAGSGLALVLVVLVVLFLVIQGSALIMGGLLAHSITSAVHELFVGTERVRLGDFRHRIRIDSKDQLGDLADSFNRMSGSIEHLLHVQREKQRLDDELRIAREIQRSLLPVTPPVMEGISLAALCEPAREVGGDYYDFFVLGPRQLGVMIADVSGKGTSAALYMAELKGLMLALSPTERSPRRLLIDANQRLAAHLDNRSFITVSYAVIDLDARTLTCARAGHTPMIVASGGDCQVVVPDGMVLGLRLPGAEEKFDELLCEHTQPIYPGDVIVMYTDGITEAMDEAGDLFGDEALAQVVAAQQHLTPAGLRERVLREVRAFVGEAEPHDDMTMIILKLDPDTA